MFISPPAVVETVPAPELGALFDGVALREPLTRVDQASALPPLYAAPLAPAPPAAAPVSVPSAPAPAWGRFDKRPDYGMIILALCTAGFFIGAASGGMHGLVAMALCVACLVSMGMEAGIRRHNALMPLARSNRRAIESALKRAPGSGLLKLANAENSADRRGAYAAALREAPAGLTPLLRILSLSIESETTELNVNEAIDALAHAGPTALPYLRALKSRAPSDYQAKLEQAILDLNRPAPQPIMDPTPTDEFQAKAFSATARARAALASSSGSLPEASRSQALRAELASFEDAMAAGNREEAAVLLARLEARLDSI